MIGVEDAFYTYDYPGYYKILPAIHKWNESAERINGGTRVAEGLRLFERQQSGMDVA
jgi:UDP-N-acetylglucosamine 4,6-dehydratase